jgi:hypothetical protein
MLQPLTHAQKIQLPKVKIDLMAEMDRITKENPRMDALKMRQMIGETFKAAAKAAGWGFYHIWPVLNEAIDVSINKTLPEEEVLGYIEALSPYCE